MKTLVLFYGITCSALSWGGDIDRLSSYPAITGQGSGSAGSYPVRSSQGMDKIKAPLCCDKKALDHIDKCFDVDINLIRDTGIPRPTLIVQV